MNNWLTIQHMKCPVCGDDVPYTDVSRKPKTCVKSQCQINYKYVQAHQTPEGKVPDYKEIGEWKNLSESSKK